MTALKRMLLVALALALASSWALGCARRAAPTPTPTPTPKAVAPTPTPTPKPPVVIKIGHTFSLTGPYEATYKGGLETQQAYIKYVNEEKPIPGVKLELLWADDASTPAQAVTNYNRFVSEGAVAVIELMTGLGMALTSLAEQDKIPVLSFWSNYPILQKSNGWHYTVIPPYEEVLHVFFPWLKSTWKGTRTPKLALVAYDTAWGHVFDAPLKKEVPAAGIELGPMMCIPPTSLDMSVEVLRLKEYKPDYVFIVMVQPHIVALLKEATKQGIKDDITWMVPSSLIYDELWVNVVGSLAEGMIFMPPFSSMLEENIEGVKFILDKQQKYTGKQWRLAISAPSMVSIMLVVEGIRLAVEKVPPEKLDGAALKTHGLDRVKDFDTMGITGPVTYGPGDVRGSDRFKIHTVDAKGKVVILKDWMPAPILQQ